MNELPVFLEPADVARRAGVSKSTVLFDLGNGYLSASARTERGGRLFTREASDAYALFKQGGQAPEATSPEPEEL